MNPQSRLMIVANRIPYQYSKNRHGQWTINLSTGGLVSSLIGVIAKSGGVWVGCEGIENDKLAVDASSLIEQASKDAGFQIKTVAINKKEYQGFYNGFSNEIIWPLFHNQPSRCNYVPHYWQTYLKINRKFADVIAENHKAGDCIWVHDYHLMMVGKSLRDMNVQASLGFFLHIPFPAPELFFTLPWRKEVLQSLIQYDVIGFQTDKDAQNFIQCVKTVFEEMTVQKYKKIFLLKGHNSHDSKVGAFPISIDYDHFEERARSEEITETYMEICNYLPNRKIIFGVERLDYSKGIPHKLRAFRNALERFPSLRRKVTLIQCVVPSREDIPEYKRLKKEIECLVSEINGAFTEFGWIPIHYMYGALKPIDLIAYYRAADILLLTPLKDGMNLVAKEYCASNIKEDGILILSEFAGAAIQFKNNALLVNPYDIRQVAGRIQEAFLMRQSERKKKMSQLRQNVNEQNIFNWANTYLQALGMYK